MLRRHGGYLIGGDGLVSLSGDRELYCDAHWLMDSDALKSSLFQQDEFFMTA